MLKIFNRLLDFNEKELNQLRPLVEKVNFLEPQMKKFKTKDFAKKTESFKKRLNKGETLDDLLPEAFALIREAIFRIVGRASL